MQGPSFPQGKRQGRKPDKRSSLSSRFGAVLCTWTQVHLSCSALDLHPFALPNRPHGGPQAPPAAMETVALQRLLSQLSHWQGQVPLSMFWWPASLAEPSLIQNVVRRVEYCHKKLRRPEWLWNCTVGRSWKALRRAGESFESLKGAACRSTMAFDG